VTARRADHQARRNHVTKPEPIRKPPASPIEEWADLAYELWALACNSIPFEPRFADEWNAQRDLLRDRFHAALAELYDGQPAADHHARLAAERCADGGELCTNPGCPCHACHAAGTEEG
jgi:hypothetical protein